MKELIANFINSIKKIKKRLFVYLYIIFKSVPAYYLLFSNYFGFISFLKQYVESDEPQTSKIILGYGIRIMVLLIIILNGLNIINI